MLAGLLQRPESLSPRRHPKRALERRNHVLRRMVEVGYLTPEQSAEAQQRPLDLPPPQGPNDLAPYFVEEVRRWLQNRYGTSSLYTGGLSVRTTLDPRLQEIANRALDGGLRELDKRQGWRGPIGKIPEGEDPTSWASPDWESGLVYGKVYDGLIVTVSKKTAEVRVGRHTGLLGKKEIKWTGQTSPAKIFTAGDLVRIRLFDPEDTGQTRMALEQEPAAQAAIVILEPSTGAVKAMIGGFDFERSEFNRAIQATRQTGSAFKPLVYASLQI